VATIYASAPELCSNGINTFTSSVTGGYGINQYQWQVNPASSGWQNISGAIFSTYIATAPPGTYAYRLLVSQRCNPGDAGIGGGDDCIKTPGCLGNLFDIRKKYWYARLGVMGLEPTAMDVQVQQLGIHAHLAHGPGSQEDQVRATAQNTDGRDEEQLSPGKQLVPFLDESFSLWQVLGVIGAGELDQLIAPGRRLSKIRWGHLS
jgi:hypothetical protein